ncbi:hypothetical protein [Planomonospora sp. ID82291]|nr:hypothetical protein [Planomonospora sp. ID82291]
MEFRFSLSSLDRAQRWLVVVVVILVVLVHQGGIFSFSIGN